jgi:hypothetical protein
MSKRATNKKKKDYKVIGGLDYKRISVLFVDSIFEQANQNLSGKDPLNSNIMEYYPNQEKIKGLKTPIKDDSSHPRNKEVPKANEKKIPKTNYKHASAEKINSFKYNNTYYFQNNPQKLTYNTSVKNIDRKNDDVVNNNKKINKRNNKDIFYAEQIKEKNNRINKLQKDLIISEMILKELKNKEDKSDTFFEKNYESINSNISNNISNTNITRINIEKNHKILTLNLNMDSFNNKKVSSLTNLRPLLTFNYINNNNIICNNNFKKGVSPENKPIPKNNYFYSLPNNNNFNYNKGSFSSKNKNKTKIIFVKKSGPFCERNINDDKSKNNKNEFENFVKKCENLKNRSKEIFNKYIKLSENIINSKNSNVKKNNDFS